MMTNIVSNIGSLKSFFSMPLTYKDVPQFHDKQLRYYFLTLNKGNHLTDIFKYIAQEYSFYNITTRLIEETDKEILLFVKIVKSFYLDDESCETLFYLDKNKMIITVITDESIHRIKRILENFLLKMHPFAEKMFITSSTIITILNSFIKIGYKVTTSMISTKKWWEKVRRTSIEFPIDVPIQEVLEEIKRTNSFINSALINIFDNQGENLILKFYISRKGLLSYIEGHYGLFEGEVIKEVIKINSMNYKELSNKNREFDKIKPIKVEFESLNEFSEQEVTHHFVSAINSNRDLSLMVYHEGNPYFYANATDISDGSTFSLLFYNKENKSELVVIPQQVASANALSKFFSLIFTEFGEGKIQFS